MLDRLNAITRRYEDLGAGADASRRRLPTRGGDQQGTVELEPLVLKAREYARPSGSLEEAKAILISESDADAELRSLAEADVALLTPRIESLEKEIKRLLVHGDPRDEKNVIVEIRAGTGGDEAALFAADLFRMYTRFGERQGWKSEILSENSIGIGGYQGSDL